MKTDVLRAVTRVQRLFGLAFSTSVELDPDIDEHGIDHPMAGAGVGGFFMLRRWRERGQKTKEQAPKDKATPETNQDYGARLDAELKALDD